MAADGGKQTPAMDAAPCGRLVVTLDGAALRIEEADAQACAMLGLERLDGTVDLMALVGESDLGPLTAELALVQPVSVPVTAVQGEPRWVDLRFAQLDGSRFAVSAVDATAVAEQRQHDEVRRQYLARLSDLALMFAFTNTLNEASVVEVACSAARRMASAERATYYRVLEFSEDRLLAVPTQQSRTLRSAGSGGDPPPLDLGRDEVLLIDALAAGPVTLAHDELPPSWAPAFADRGTEEAVLLPVFRNDAVGGLMVIETRSQGRTWLLEELELLQAAMALFGAALDRLMARLDLERSEAFSGSVVSAIADGILVVSQQQRITMANPSACRSLAPLLGVLEPGNGDLGPAAPLIAGALDTEGAHVSPDAHPIVRALTDDETVQGVTVGLPHGDDRDLLWLEMSAQPLRHAGEGPGAVVVSFSDVTQRRRYEAELLLARDAALDASRLKGAFLANMSHEIRTPMNGVIGTAALLLESGLSSRQREYALTLKGAAESLLTILDDVLDLSKIEAGRMDIEAVAFDPVELVDGVLELLAHSAAEKGLRLTAAPDEALWARVVADPHRTRQVLNNLVGNAIKFTDQGRVELRVAGVMREGKAWLRFEVRDSGIGMTPDTAAHAFDRFTQADTSTTRRFGGTGLGLSISKQLVELMGGRIEVESTDGEGSRFSFEIPSRVVEGVDALEEPVLRNQRVLVAVDDQAVRELIFSHLIRWGARPVTPERLAKERPEQAARLVAVVVEKADVGTLEALPGWGIDAPGVRLLGPGEVAYDGDVPWPITSRGLRRALRRAVDPWSTPPTGPRRVDQHPGLIAARVLVVEDQPVNQLVARSMLELLGCDVTLATHGAEAIGMMAEDRFDIVFMDCQMPMMDGFEATRRMRAQESAEARIPIVAVSASAMGTERVACEAAGMDDFLAKPVRLEDFEAALHRWVGQSPGGLVEERSPEAATPYTPPLIDEQTLSRLRAVKVGEGEADLVSELTELFVVEAASRLEAMAGAIAAGDAAAFKAHTHSLKGSASTLGALRLASACLSLEEQIAAVALTGASERLDELKALYDETRQALGGP